MKSLSNFRKTMPEPVSTISPVSLPKLPKLAGDDARLMAAAKELEASFLAEMLKAAKFGEPRKAFGGGAGEEQFASFFRNEVAKQMTEAGGIGLSQQLFQALKARDGNGDAG